MDNLRWSLLLIGILLVAGIYVWDRLRRRRTPPAGGNLDTQDKALLESLDAGRRVPDTDLKEALGELNGLRGEHPTDETLDIDELRTLVPDPEGTNVDRPGDGGVPGVEDEVPPASSEEPRRGEPSEELVIVLNVMAASEQTFPGTEVRKALEEVDLRHGDMRIFHHFGVGEMSVDGPVFSVANILEPGFFELERMDAMATPGVCMFMRLPGPLDGRVAFELLLSTGRRLAQQLGGELRDETRSVLSLQKIAQIRERIGEFDRRQLAAVE